jgi:hypothetical protein
VAALRTRFRFVLRSCAKWRHAGAIRKASFFPRVIRNFNELQPATAAGSNCSGSPGDLPKCRTTSRGNPASSSSRSSKPLRSSANAVEQAKSLRRKISPPPRAHGLPRGQCRGGIPESDANATFPMLHFHRRRVRTTGAGSIEPGELVSKASILYLAIHFLMKADDAAASPTA